MSAQSNGASERVLSHGFCSIVRTPEISHGTDLTVSSFFEEAPRIAHPDYIPIEADVLRARTKTTGIYETRFTMGTLSIQYVTETRI